MIHSSLNINITNYKQNIFYLFLIKKIDLYLFFTCKMIDYFNKINFLLLNSVFEC